MGTAPNETSRCARCGSPYLAAATGGLCPQCVGRQILSLNGDGGDRAARPAALMHLGDYELLDKIAEGGMGVVFKARDVKLDRLVAIKMVRAGQFAAEAEIKRFRAEAEAAAQLTHPNIVPIYDVGEQDGRHYFSMGLIEGQPLSALIRDGCWFTRYCPAHCPSLRFIPGGRGCCATAAAVMAKVARAVHYAHQRGILHRDLKPGNILVDRQGEPHVADFGLAKRIESPSDLTVSGEVIGSPSYMAPEQAAGRMKKLTTAADIYSLGAILYELLTGQPPFKAGTPLETMRLVMETEPLRPSAINPRVDRDLAVVCLKCLEKDPARRYGSAEALVQDLERWLAHEPIHARPAGGTERLVKWARRNPRVAGLAGLLHLVVLAGLLGIVWQWRVSERHRLRAEHRAAESHERLMRTHRLQAQQQLAIGDPVAALPWLAVALREEPAEASNRDYYRAAIANTLRTLPVLEHVWWGEDQGAEGALSPDGTLAAITAGEARHVRFVSLESGDYLGSAMPVEGGFAPVFSPDGSRLAVCGRHRVGVYSVANRQAVFPSLVHTGWVRAAFSGDGRWLLTQGEKSVRLWDAQTGEATSQFLLHPAAPRAVFHPDSRVLFTSVDNVVQAWAVPSGAWLRSNVISLSKSGVCAVSPDGRWLALGGYRPNVNPLEVNRYALFLDAATLAGVGQHMPHLESVIELAFSPDGRSLATGSGDPIARVWAVPDGVPISPAIRLHDKPTALAFSPDGQVLAVGCEDGRLRLWEARSGAPLSPWLRHGGQITRMAFRPSGQQVMTSSHDGTVRVWSVHRREPKPRRLEASVPVWHAGFTPDTRRVILMGPKGVDLVETATGRGLASLPHAKAVDFAVLSPDGSRLLIYCRDGELRLWQVPSVQLEQAWTLPDRPRQLAWFPNGRRFAALLRTGELFTWSGVENEPLAKLHPEATRCLSLAVSADGRRLAAGFAFKRFGLWDGATLRPVVSTNHQNDIHELQFSQDGAWLATGDAAGQVFLCRASDGQIVTAMPRHAGRVGRLAFSPDGRMLASRGEEETVRISRVPSGEPVGTVIRPAPRADLLVWSPDSRRLMIEDNLGGQIWDVQASSPITAHVKHTAELAGGAFTPDGRRLFAVTQDAHLFELRLDVPDWPDEDWQFLVRTFTSLHVDADGSQLSWRELTDAGTKADVEALTARWQKLRPRLQQMLAPAP